MREFVRVMVSGSNGVNYMTLISLSKIVCIEARSIGFHTTKIGLVDGQQLTVKMTIEEWENILELNEITMEETKEHRKKFDAEWTDEIKPTQEEPTTEEMLDKMDGFEGEVPVQLMKSHGFVTLGVVQDHLFLAVKEKKDDEWEDNIRFILNQEIVVCMVSPNIFDGMMDAVCEELE